MFLLNKATRGFAGGHQNNILFPVYMALEVKPDAIQYMGPTRGLALLFSTGSKFKYLNHVHQLEANGYP